MAAVASAMLALAALAACSGPIDYRLARVTPAMRRLPSALPTVHVTLESPAQGAGPLPSNSQQIADAWAQAVTAGMARTGLFSPREPQRLTVAITIQGLAGPDPIGELSAAAAHYVVRLGQSGRVLLDTTILTDGSSPLGSNVDETQGDQEAKDRAVRANIQHFLGSLESIDPLLVALPPAS